MFNKLKQFKDLRSQAKNLQNSLAEEITSVEKNGIKVEMDGNINIKNINIDSELSGEELSKALTETINGAIKKTQKNMAAKIQQMGGLPGM